MSKLDQLLNNHRSAMEELNFPGLELNFNHYMDITKGNANCVFGLYWLMSYGTTGHSHIVMVPQIDKPIEEWPIAFYDDDHGTAYIISSSIKTWLPAYFIFKVSEWYPAYLRHGNSVPWISEVFDSWKKNKKHIVKQGSKYMNDFGAFYDGFLATIKKKGDWNSGERYKLVEPGSFLTEYYEMQTNQSSPEKWKAHILKCPVFNKPLFDRLSTEAVQSGDEDADPDLCWEFWNRFLKCDIAYYKVLPAVVKTIVEKSPKAESPYYSLIERIYSVTAKDPYGNYDGADGLFLAGREFEKRKEYARAVRCFENSILMNRAETGTYHEDAYEHILVNAGKICHPHYRAYLEETSS